MTSAHEPTYQTHDSAGNKYGETTSTQSYALDPKQRKRKTIALLERVSRGEVTPARAFELLKELI